MKINCIFKPEIECPVRKEIKAKMERKMKLDKVIKPLGDTELMKMYMPIFDKMGEMLYDEFGALSKFCICCPLIREKSDKK